MPDLARGRFSPPLPYVWVEENVITFQYRYIPTINRIVASLVPPFEIKLSSSIPWEIEFRSNISNLNADLRGLELRSLDLLGGASQIKLLLSRPNKTTFIYITGGIRNGTIGLPPSVGVRVQVSGGVSNLGFDSQHFDIIGSDTHLENSTSESATSRCDISISDGANNVTIDEWSPF